MAQFKLSGEQIAKAIVEVDENILTWERLEALLKYIPLSEEIEAVGTYEGKKAKKKKKKKIQVFFSTSYTHTHRR